MLQRLQTYRHQLRERRALKYVERAQNRALRRIFMGGPCIIVTTGRIYCGSCRANVTLGEPQHQTIPSSDIPGCGAQFKLVAYDVSRTRAWLASFGGPTPDEILELYPNIPHRYFRLYGRGAGTGWSRELLVNEKLVPLQS